MNRILYRHIKTAFATVSHGEGPYILDKNDKQYLDASRRVWGTMTLVAGNAGIPN
ncbi:MAG: hypothetical protein GKR96_10740 [Gammaproteobacteria bacterium]|nr:hypothetical protein [Gammaproteobacteria bacterium]